MLLECHPPDGGDQYNAHSRPDGIRNAHRDVFQHQAEAVEGASISGYGYDGGQEPGKLFALLQERGGDCFQNNRQQQDKICFHGFVPDKASRREPPMIMGIVKI